MSSSSSKPQWTYDVFINFRGGDTRRDFVSHLYYALSNAGVNTFFDEENLLKGTPLEELTRAIEGSQIAIVVFSETYSESTWCLTELEKIIDCHESYGQIVVPIFYGVEASVLRNPRGRFGKALEVAAQKKFSADYREYGLSRWKNALNKASNLSGWDLKNHRNTAKLVKDIVEDILTKLDYALLSITEFPVGVESRVQQVIEIIENQSAKVYIIGIWGMGGSGKTTIAKAIYNQIHHRAYVTEILNGCGLHADIGITVLIERSLLKVEKNNKLGMHQLLRDMGREIICESSRKEPGKRSRLWFHEDVIDVLTNNSGTETIEGLTMKLHFTGKDCFKAYAFDEMKRLKLLQLDHVQLTGNFGYLSKQLRWICWQGFPSKYIPKKFYMEGAIVIDLKHSNLQVFWKEPQVLGRLKILNLSHSKYLTVTPDFSKLPNLEKLVLKDCPRLCKVHKSIGDLCNLLLINLKDCKSLSNLPRGAYKLKSVKTLILSGCSKIDKLEEDVVQMESLTTLIAENTAMKQVPFSIVKSKSIGYISLCGYEGFSRNVFPSIIRSWMSPTMNPLSYIQPFCSTSSYLVSMDMQSYNLGDLAPMLSSLSNLRSVLVQCDTESQVSKQVRRILDDNYGVNFTPFETTSQTSNHYFKSYLIGIGSYQEVFSILSDSISEGLATSEYCDAFLPGANDPFWLAHTSEGHSVYFSVPDNCRMKGMTLCVVYLSTPESTVTEYLISVLMVNYTRCTIQIFKRETVFSFNDEDWQAIVSNSGPGDKLEIFVNFAHGLVVKKTAIYLMCDESIDKENNPSPEPKKEPKKNVFKRFIKKVVM
ncbi:unnamed protein product [Sphenostylis stenocarpa]|uniref:TIR domain-containing protein n=1 Tax=Sphenostylis stenocarpa TaxID=92480 RepID=A0AA86T3F6_9FABA|nr:unnamed protein product [Sphenostylis stenocarpa]